MLAPIVIFAFNRPEAFCNLIDSLENNYLFLESEKFIFIDGCRNDSDRENVNKTIELARKVTPNVIISEMNRGLGASVISGVTEVLSKYDKVIVLEDDLYCAPGFLLYMNQGLDFYSDDHRIISICGYGLKIKRPQDYSTGVYLSNRSSSWGWATWRDRWENIDWEIKDWDKLSSSKKMQRQFNAGGSDMFGMLKGYMTGKNHSWAIRFCYNQSKQNLFSIHPFMSFVDNKGFGANATNCKQKFSRFRVEMNMSDYLKIVSGGGNSIEADYFGFSHDIIPDERILSQLRAYHSVPARLYSKIRKILNI